MVHDASSAATRCSPRGWRCWSIPRSRWARCARSPASRAPRWSRAAIRSPGRSCTRCASASDSAHSLGGGTVYYGSIDATPAVRHAAGRGRPGGAPTAAAVAELLPAADRALEWIETLRRPGRRRLRRVRAGDRPRPAEPGLEGLLRRGDLRRRADRRAPRSRWPRCRATPMRPTSPASQLARQAGDEATAQRWARARGRALRAAFNRDFWLPDQGWFALGLDRDKRAIDSLASNMGHCLWTGIVDEDKAAAVAEHLLSPEMFTGWGVRTLASSMAAYNPMSYHNGSVWPHDNALIAAGPHALRLRRARPADRRRPDRGRRPLRRPAPGAVLRLRPHRVRRRPSPIRPRAPRRRGRRPARCCCCGPCSASTRRCPTTGCGSPPNFPPSWATCPSSGWPLAGARMTVTVTGGVVQTQGLPPRGRARPECPPAPCVPSSTSPSADRTP